MAIKEILEFKGDEWTKQDEESERGFFYFDQYKMDLYSRDGFKELILEEADQRTSKGHLNFTYSDKKYNDEHQKEIQKYIDSKGKKGKPPKPYAAIADWFRLHKWLYRRTKFNDNNSKEANEAVKTIKTNISIEIANEIADSIRGTLHLKKKLRQEGRLSLSQDKAGSESVNISLNSLDNLSGESQEKKVKVDATLDAEIDAKKSNYLFVEELDDYNLDDALSEVTEHVGSDNTSDNG